MEDKFSYPNPTTNDATIGILRTVRDISPAHYTFKIESFSLLLDSEAEVIEFGHFDACGYKWRLSFYPQGNKQENGNGHISLYLSIVETNYLPLTWEVNVTFKFFVFDQIRDKYLTIQDADGKVRSFHRMKSKWGIAQLLSLNAFNDSSKGYLLNDCCIFGVEIFVIKGTGKGETLSMVKTSTNNQYTYKIENFSALNQNCISSEVFTIAGRKWKLALYPRGYSTEKEQSLSLYLSLAASETLPSKWKLYAKYKLRLIDQISGNHLEGTVRYWFDTDGIGYGYNSLVPLSDLKSKGYLVEDRIIVEVEVDVVSVVKDFS